MPRWIRHTIIAFTALLALAVTGLIVLVRTLDFSRYAGLAVEEVKRATGREFRVAGRLDVEIFPRPAIVAEDVVFGNAAWGSRPEMAKIKRIEGEIEFLPLLHREIRVVRLVAVEPDILLETSAQGVGNWTFGADSAKAAAADAPAALSLEVRALEVERGTLAYRDGASGEILKLSARRLDLIPQSAAAPIDLKLDVAIRDQAFTIKGKVGALKRFLARDRAWPVDIELAGDGAAGTFAGTIDWSRSNPSAAGALKAQVRDRAVLQRLAGTALAVPVPLAISAQVRLSAGEQSAEAMQLTLGDTAIAGSATLRTGGAHPGTRPYLSAQLKSPAVDLAPFAGRELKDAPFPPGWLHALDADVDLAVDHLVLPNKQPLEAVQLRASLKAGAFEAQSLQATIAGSTVQGSMTLRSDGPRPYVGAHLRSPAVDLTPFAGRGEAPKAPAGRVFSDAPIPLGWLHALDADADLAVDHLVLPNKLPLDETQLRASLKGGRLEVQSLQGTLAGGSLRGRAVLDAAQAASPTLAVELAGRGIDLSKIANAVGDAREASGGKSDIAVDLTGPAGSLHGFVAGASGELRVEIGPARIAGGAVKGGNTLNDILDKADTFRRSDATVELKCAVVRLAVREGIATAQRTIAYETSKVNMVIAGTIDLRTETLDLAIRPTVKEGLGIAAKNLAELVRVTGTLAKPEIGIDTAASARAALSLGGAIATGGISMLGESLLSKGTADRSPCQSALAENTAAPERSGKSSRGVFGVRPR